MSRTALAPPRPTTADLPTGFAVRLDESLRWLDGRTVLGGTPTALLRFPPATRDLVRHGRFAVRDAATARLAGRLLDAGVAHPEPPPAWLPVSVVVPVYRRAGELRRLLSALDLPDGSEVIVVDDASPDGAGIAAVARAAAAGLVRHERNQGPAAARNTGLALAAHGLVVFLDSDVVPTPGWLPPLLAHFADPAVALVAPRITGLAGSGGTSVGDYELARSSLDLGSRAAPVVPCSRVAYVPSAAVVVRASAVADGFATELRVGEDVDQVYRLHAAGWRLRYEPAATVTHEHRLRPGAWLGRKAFYGTSAAPLAQRHPGWVPPVRLPGWAFAACVLLGRGTPAGVVAAAVLLGAGTRALASSLGDVPAPVRTAAALNAEMLGGAAVQLATAAGRHWWPVTALTVALSRRSRGPVALALLAEGLLDWWSHARGAQDPLRYLVLHRLDDLAYGAGVWAGAIRGRTLAPLLPRLRFGRPGGRRPGVSSGRSSRRDT